MPTFEELKQRYMLTGGGGGSGGDPAIPIYSNCEVTPIVQEDRSLLGNATYSERLKSKIVELGSGTTTGQFIYIAGWWIGERFSLDGPTSANRLTDLLIQKSRAGVDVRVMGWVMAPEVLQSSMIQGLPAALDILDLNSDTMRFINALRAEPSLANKAVLNILAHPAGAVHMKMALVGTAAQAIGYTGGLDFERRRQMSIWHDVEAEVIGPAVQSLFDTFRLMWNEVRGRAPVAGLRARSTSCDSHTSSMPDLAARTVASTTTSRMHVQSVRTFPQYRFASLPSIGTSMTLPTNAPLSFAPAGLFEVKRVWQKGISGAQTYIYLEDQAFTSNEVFDWINAAIKANPELRVALVAGGEDPTAPSPQELTKAAIIAVNNHLLSGLNGGQIARVAFFKHKDPRKFIHTKSTLVDDNWAIVGSANCMRRSLYTDLEHSIAYMDEANRSVGSYRMDLWGTLLQSSIPDLQAALSALFAVPFHGSGGPGSQLIERLRLPFPAATLTQDEQVYVDDVLDTDSRQTWPDKLISQYMRQHGAGSLSP